MRSLLPQPVADAPVREERPPPAEHRRWRCCGVDGQVDGVLPRDGGFILDFALHRVEVCGEARVVPRR